MSGICLDARGLLNFCSDFAFGAPHHKPGHGEGQPQLTAY